MTPSEPPAANRHDPLLVATGAFIMLWTVARAAVQSITIDEADTYLYFVADPSASHWRPSANNHVLNSMLMRLVTQIFGASPLTLRLPALLGAALYLLAAYFLARLISERRWLRWGFFVCLTASPFVMDYLVAARGYSLASAFLLGMAAIAARYQAQDPKARGIHLRRTCALISISGALSISANFAFAIADVLVGLGLFLWIAGTYRREYARILAWFTLPGLAVGYFLVGSVVLSFSKGEFTWGADSLWKMLKSLVSASLFRPNEYLLNPRIHHYFVHFGPFLYPLLAAFVLWRIVMVTVEDRRSPLAAICGAALAIAIVIHLFLYFWYGILLPLDRTAMWVVLLVFVGAGALAGVPLSSRIGRGSGQALTAILVLIGVYNLGCLRLTYFNEWQYDADMKHIYSVLAYYNHTYGVTRVSANWRYVAALNCYRDMSGRETLEEIPGASSVAGYYPPGYQAYVVFYPSDEDFYKKEGLKLVYRDPFTQASVAIRPDVESAADNRALPVK